ncbi:MAG: histidine phosphatase family protein [Armatimonadetes bacterium]|nr:histidine phosphatase family protein [Armatimonadota bacterium]
MRYHACIVRIYFVRHGETSYNKEGRLQGDRDIPLSETGKAQSKAVAERLWEEFDRVGEKPAAIYTSLLSRSLDTAKIIGEELQVSPSPVQGLQEMDLGEWEGKTPSELKDSYFDVQNRPLFLQWKEDPTEIRVPGGESIQDVEKRVTSSLEQIITLHGSTDNVVIVTHCGPISVVLAGLLNGSLKDAAKIKQDSTSVTVLEVDGDLYHSRVLSVNDSSHLERLKSRES